MIAIQRHPVFLVLEGLDGSGKTTVAKRAAEIIGARYMTTPSEAVRAHREAIVTSFGPSQEAAQLFYLATVLAASREVEACLTSGVSVVLDRYFLSTQVYAEFRGSQLRIEDEIERLLRPADFTIFLDASLDLRRSRMAQRADTSAADRETYDLVADSMLRAGYELRLENQIVGNLIRVDTSQGDANEVAAYLVRQIGYVRRLSCPNLQQSDLMRSQP